MQARLANPLTRKLAHLAALSPTDIEVLDALQSPTRFAARDRELISVGRRYDGLLILIEGVAIRSRVLHDGRRQILNVAIPGDILGFPACFFEQALFSVSGVTDTLVSPVSFDRLLQLFEQQPRAAATIFWSFAREAAMFAEHLIDVGRRSPLERLGHFLLEMLLRLRAVGLAEGNSYRMPLTQELLADALGLSLQHVNRTLRQLREEALIVIDRQNVAISNVDGLAALTDFDMGYFSRFCLADLPAVAGLRGADSPKA